MMAKRKPIRVLFACINGHGESKNSANMMARHYGLTSQDLDIKKTDHVLTTPSGREVLFQIRGLNLTHLMKKPFKHTQELRPEEVESADAVLSCVMEPRGMISLSRPDLVAVAEKAKREGRYFPLDEYFEGTGKNWTDTQRKMRELLT